MKPPFQPFRSEEEMKIPLNKEDKKSENRYSVLIEFRSLRKSIILPVYPKCNHLNKYLNKNHHHQSTKIFYSNQR